ncbi:hypothetical protein RYA05_04810 [Pseudomonas syringae pv. actinidiae]|nr:hypothetical protein [Pseudomonas syringae pv. actinidiae]
MNILIAHELGTGRDGIVRISSVAQSIKEAYPGSFVVLSMKRLSDSKIMCNKYIDKIINNPVDTYSSDSFGSLNEYAHRRYFSNEESYRSLCNKWKTIIKNEKPDIIISDNSPSAMIMGRIFGIPVIEICTSMYAARKPTTTKLENSNNSSFFIEAENILADMNATSALVQRVVVGIPSEAEESEGISFGYIESEKDDDGGLNIDVFAYIKKSDPHRNEIIMALDQVNADLGKKILAVIPGIDPMLYKSDFELTPHFMRLPGALYSSPLVVHSFGSGLSMEALRNGCPMWGIPSNPEQRFNKSSLSKLHAGISSPKSVEDIVSSLISSVENSKSHRDEAKKVWGRAIKNGLLPLSTIIVDKIGVLKR